MSSKSIARFIIPVAVIYALGLVIPYILLTNTKIGQPSVKLADVQEYIDILQVSIPVSL